MKLWNWIFLGVFGGGGAVAFLTWTVWLIITNPIGMLIAVLGIAGFAAFVYAVYVTAWRTGYMAVEREHAGLPPWWKWWAREHKEAP